MAFLFIRISYVYELVYVATGVYIPLNYIVGVLFIIALLFSGRLKMTLVNPVVRAWILFTLWMFACVPLSLWPRESLDMIEVFVKFGLVMAVVPATVFLSRRQVHRMMVTIGFAGFVNVLAGLFATTADGARLKLSGGLMGNANDYAAHLVFVIPFIGYALVSNRCNPLVRLIAAVALVLAAYLTFSTGSRGALIALFVECLVLLIWCSWRSRLVATAGVAIVAILAMAAVPTETRQRLATATQSDFGGDSNEAGGSAEGRLFLMEQGVRATILHPLFGVGPGMFSTYVGQEENFWKGNHNSFLEISSETGIPGLLLLLYALGLGYKALRKPLQTVKSAANGVELRQPLITVLISLVGFSAAAFFLTLGYFMYFPFLTSLAYALKVSYDRETSGAGALG